MEDRWIARERARQDVSERREHEREDEADDDRPPDHAHPRLVGAVGVAGAERPADDHLAGDRERVEDQREQDEELVRDLMRAELRVAHAREHRGGNEKRSVERRGPHEDLPADAEERLHRPQARPPRGRVRPQQLDDEGGAHRGLRDRRACRRARDPPVEDVDEDDLEDEVEQVREDDDLERPSQVRDAAQVALTGKRDERRRQPDRGDSEVREREVPRPAVAAEALEQRHGDELAGEEHQDADAERGPERLRCYPGGFVVSARA